MGIGKRNQKEHHGFVTTKGSLSYNKDFRVWNMAKLTSR